MFGDWAMSLLELLFRFSGGTFGALGILTKRAYPTSALQVPVEPCFTARCRFLRWGIVSRSVGLQPANCLLYHHSATGKPLNLQPCRVRRSDCFRVLVRMFVVVLLLFLFRQSGRKDRCHKRLLKIDVKSLASELLSLGRDSESYCQPRL